MVPKDPFSLVARDWPQKCDQQLQLPVAASLCGAMTPTACESLLSPPGKLAAAGSLLSSGLGHHCFPEQVCEGLLVLLSTATPG